MSGYNPIAEIPHNSNGDVYPKFRNDAGVKEIRIGVTEFECIGATPPNDHPHVYLEMGTLNTIACLYCNTTFVLDEDLRPFDAIPPECIVPEPYSSTGTRG
jgi:uncharacterized Zn-finger protein